MVWFKHDTNASVDAKLQTLMLDYGAAGYGLYWYCVELIAQKVDRNNITFELEHDARIIARNLNLSVQETTDMMKKMVDLELFSFSENNKLACYALAKRLDQSMTSNKGFRQIIDNIKNSHDPIMTTSSFVMNRREEKRREENNIQEVETEEVKPKSEKLPRSKPKGFEYPEEFEKLWASYKHNNKGDKWNGFVSAKKRFNDGYKLQDLYRAIKLENKKDFAKRNFSTILNGDIDEDVNAVAIQPKTVKREDGLI